MEASLDGVCGVGVGALLLTSEPRLDLFIPEGGSGDGEQSLANGCDGVNGAGNGNGTGFLLLLLFFIFLDYSCLNLRSHSSLTLFCVYLFFSFFSLILSCSHTYILWSTAPCTFLLLSSLSYSLHHLGLLFLACSLYYLSRYVLSATLSC